jgi:RimJ/RimL family protein N-acetyltransferase
LDFCGACTAFPCETILTKDRCTVLDKDWLRWKRQSRNDLRLCIPKPEDGWFYVKMLSDPATMAYNAPWFPPDGCIPNPEAECEGLCRNWIGQEPERFYADLQRKSDGAFVGDVNFRYNPDRDRWDMGIVIYAPERGKGYGKQGLRLLIDRAFRVAGVSRLHNEFEATREAAYHIHKAVGFREVGEENGIIQLLLTKEG